MAFYIHADTLNDFLSAHSLDTVTDFKRHYNIGALQDVLHDNLPGELHQQAVSCNAEVTTIIENAFGVELFTEILNSKMHKPMCNERAFACERLLTMDENKQVKDIYLLYDVCRGKWAGEETTDLHVALLYVEMRNIPFNFICYKAIYTQEGRGADDGVIWYSERLKEFVQEKTGIQFTFSDDPRTVKYEEVVFPYPKESATDDASVKSACYVMNDVAVPAYISYNSNLFWKNNCPSRASLDRYGSMKTSAGHSVIGFSGWCPMTFFSTSLDYSDEGFDDITTYATFFNDGRCDVSMLTKVEEKSEKASTSAVLKEVGVVADIYVGDGRGMSISTYNSMNHRAHNKHAPHTVKKWEPSDTTAFRLEEVPEIRVFRLVGVSDTDNFTETPAMFYVQSETGKWYEYNYMAFEERLVKAQAIKNFEVAGTPNDLFFDMPYREYMFGYKAGNDWVFEYGGVERLKDAAQAQGKKIKTLHSGAYLSMQNDMRTVWELCESIQSGGII